MIRTPAQLATQLVDAFGRPDDDAAHAVVQMQAAGRCRSSAGMKPRGRRSTWARCDGNFRDLTFYEEQVRGPLFGSSNPRDDIFRLLALYESGQVKLDN